MSELIYKRGSNSSHRWLIPLLLFLLIGSVVWYTITRGGGSSNRQSSLVVSPTSSAGLTFSNSLVPITSAASDIVNTANSVGGDAVTTIGSFFTQPSSNMASSANMVNSIIGQQVQLSDVLVNRVTGDKTFIISSDTTNKVYVALTDNLKFGSVEQARQIKDGQRVRITGVVKAMPSVEMITNLWKLPYAEADIATKYSYYIEATQVTVLVDTSVDTQ